MSVDVLIAADQPVVRRTIQSALEAAGCRIVGESVADVGAVDLAVSNTPDVIVLAWTTPDEASLDLLRQLRFAVPHGRIVVRSPPPAGEAAVSALEAGADEYVDYTDLTGLVAAVVQLPRNEGPPPSTKVTELRAVDPAGPHPALPLEPYRVLVVDDDPTARRLLRLSLELEGAEVTEAASLEEATAELTHRFDGVVLDRRLPDGDGLDLVPVLAERHPQASIVVCSNVEDHAEPWFVVHVPKIDMESVVSALGLVGRERPSLSAERGLGAPVPEIVGRWIARLGRQVEDPPPTAAHALVAQLVHAAFGRRAADAAGEIVLPEAGEQRHRAEVTVRQLVDLREVVTGELARQLSPERAAGTVTAVNREVDVWILGVVARDVERLRRQASTDALTGLLNRRAFDEALTQEVARASRYRRPFSVIMMDLDGLKAINDHHGHSAGDAALVAMARAIRASLRSSDSAYRVGGDEFVILLPETPKRLIAAVIDRIRGGGGPAFSWGASTYLEDTADSHTVIDLADRQLLAQRRASRG